MWKQIATGAILLVAVATSGTLLLARAAPQPPLAGTASTSRLAGGKTFAPTCKANEIVDSRPDPAWVGAGFAGDNCWAPRMPAPVNGYTASREQVVASMAAMKRYAAASDTFQRCVQDFVAARKGDKSKKPIGMPLVIIENHRLLASENNKRKVADQVRVTINAFNEYGSDCPG